MSLPHPIAPQHPVQLSGLLAANGLVVSLSRRLVDQRRTPDHPIISSSMVQNNTGGDPPPSMARISPWHEGSRLDPCHLFVATQALPRGQGRFCRGFSSPSHSIGDLVTPLFILSRSISTAPHLTTIEFRPM